VRHRVLVAALPALALLLAACGDDGEPPEISADEEPFVDAMTSAFTQSPVLPFRVDQARCVSEVAIDTIGVDRLEAAAVTPEGLVVATGVESLGVELSEDDADAIADAFGDCDISLADAVVAGASQRGDALPESTASCVRDELDEKEFAGVFARSLLDDDPEPSSEFDAFFLELAEACPQLDPIPGT
jgi:hypothetical protein